MMKISSPVLLTGATGFVGGHLAEALGRSGIRTRLLVRSASRLAFPPGRFHETCLGDVTDAQSVKKAMKGVKTVLHLAGVLRGFCREDYARVNEGGARILATAALASKTVKRFVYVGSLAAAGPTRKGRPLTEKDAPAPVSFYGETKLAGELAVTSILGRKVPWTLLRPGAVYGPREKDIFQYFQMVKSGVVFLPCDGTQVASYVHVDDLVQAILKAALSPRAVGQTYFVASEDASWLRLTALISEALGRRPLTLKIPLPLVKLAALGSEVMGRLRGQAAILNCDKVKEAAPEAWTCDSAKIKRELSWRPKWTLRDGVKQAAESYVKAGWL